jgi:CBS domain-containing protein
MPVGQGPFSGRVAPADLRMVQKFQGFPRMIVRLVSDLIDGHDLPCVDTSMIVPDACHLLDRLDIGAAAALEDPRLVGVFSECDAIRKCICRDGRGDDTLVSEIMTPDPGTIARDGTVAQALNMMLEGGWGR